MAYNIVKKSGSTCLVEKFRDGPKVSEKYILSLGVHDDVQHNFIRKTVHDLAQEDRVNWCMKSGMVVEVPKDIPRRKAPTGDIREQPVKKPRTKRVKVVKEDVKKSERVIWETRPFLKAGSLKSRETEDVELISKQQKVFKSKEELDTRISKIEEDVKFSKAVIKQKKNVASVSRMQQESVNRDIAYHESVADSGNKAITILRKQKSSIR